ncbi:hypothetical protein IU483_27655 [Streptomyces gardneri]|nr:hypothetical protein [Streptomyces gardneri]
MGEVEPWGERRGAVIDLDVDGKSVVTVPVGVAEVVSWIACGGRSSNLFDVVDSRARKIYGRET